MLTADAVLVLEGVAGAADSDFLRIRSYNAARLEVDGVSGAVSASSPRWCVGVSGRAELEDDGVTKPLAGARLGVANVEVGVSGRETDSCGLCRADTGVIGNGIAKSWNRFVEGVRSFEGETERLGDGGACKTVPDVAAILFGDFGESDASRCVKADCLTAGATKGGRSASGIGGTPSLSSSSSISPSACSYLGFNIIH